MSLSGKNSLGWTQTSHAAAVAAAHRLATELRASHADGVIPALLARCEKLAEDLQSAKLLEQFALVLLALDLDASEGVLSDADAARLLGTALGILRVGGIDARESRIGYLHLEVALRASALASRQGLHEKALTELILARGACTNLPSRLEVTAELRAAACYMRLGHASQALEHLGVAEHLVQTADPAEVDDAQLHEARIARLETMRIAGDAEGAAELAAALAHAASRMQEATKKELAWQTLLVTRASAELDRALLQRALEGEELFAVRAFELLLRAYAARPLPKRQAIPKIASLRRRLKERGDLGASTKPLLNAIAHIEAVYDNASPIGSRAEKVFEVLRLAPRFVSLEQEMLVAAAATRWFLRHHQRLAAEAAYAHYRKLSLSVSNGHRFDALRLFDSEIDRDTGALSIPVERGEDDVTQPTLSTTRRRLVMAQLSLEFAGVAVASKARRALARKSERERLRNEVNRELGEKLFQAFGSMRGLAAKLGQSMSYVELPVPEPMRVALAGLADQCAPVAPKIIEDVIAAELGRPVHELFQAFNPEPVATASIGQVHWAMLPNGTEVAVKVQIPGVVAAIRTDLGNLELIKPVVKWMVPAGNLEGVIEHLAERFEEELDYAREAAHLETFRKAFAGDDRIIVPRVFSELSTARVLTMEFVRGARLDEFCATATNEDRALAGETIYRMFETAFWRHGLFNGDPNPGNFLFRPRGEVAFIDFGSVTFVDPTFIAAWRTVTHAILNRDDAALAQALRAMGVVSSGREEPFLSLLKNASQAMWGHLLHQGPYKFKPAIADDAQFLKRIHKDALQQINLPSLAGSFLRTGVGIASILARLEAEADFRGITTDLLSDDDRAA